MTTSDQPEPMSNNGAQKKGEQVPITEKPSLVDYLNAYLPFKIPRIPLPQTAKNFDKAIAAVVLSVGEYGSASLGRRELYGLANITKPKESLADAIAKQLCQAGLVIVLAERDGDGYQIQRQLQPALA